MSNQVEYTLIVDENDNVVGKKIRSEITRDDIYRVSSLWIFNKKRDLLIAQRPLWKKKGAGKWTESAVGTLEADETYESNLIKEAKEELGISLKLEELIFISKEFYSSEKSKMFGSIYAYILDSDIKFDLNTYEVPQVEWISNRKLLKELNMDDNRFVGGFRKFYLIVWNKLYVKNNLWS